MRTTSALCQKKYTVGASIVEHAVTHLDAEAHQRIKHSRKTKIFIMRKNMLVL